MGEWTSTLRLGSTSYVYPDDVLPNVRRLAGWVQDIEWVVFEVAHGLPQPDVIAEMARLGQVYGHSYTVHLPLGLGLATESDGEREAGLETARRVMTCARALAPWAYVLHLEGPGSGERWGPWQERAAASLAALAEEAGGLERLAVENVPEYPAEHLWPLLERLPVSMCLDVGHLLRQRRNPLPALEGWLERSRAVHLHGLEDGRDHRSLSAVDQGLLLRVLRVLYRARYRGVVTIECFESQAFAESWELVEDQWVRLQKEED